MVGTFAEHSSAFLRVIAVMVVLAFSIPISLAPLRWARSLRWTVDQQSDLAVYFARCLGVVALVLSWAGWHAASHADLQPFFFKMLIGIFSLLTLVHIVGALQKVQPWTETAEIPFWGGLVVLGLLFYPAV
jgi:hypothetical protein